MAATGAQAAGTTATGAGAKPPSSWSANEVTEYNYLLNVMHYTSAQATGIMGNTQTESNFNPKATNPSGARAGGLGIGQWTQGRYDNLVRYASSHGLSVTSMAAQLGFMNSELSGPYSKANAAVRADSTPQQAALDFSRLFEINDVRYTDIRATRAGILYGQLGGTSGPLAGGSAVGTAGTAATGTAGTGSSGAASAAGTAASAAENLIPGVNTISKGIDAVISDVTKPLVFFLVNATCVIVGAVLLFMAAHMLADAAGAPSSTSGSTGGTPTKSEGAKVAKVGKLAALA